MPVQLREWVPFASLVPPPPPPLPGWHRRLRMGDEVEALHEGGWWHVVLKHRVPGNVRLGEPPAFIVEAVGYGVTREVRLDDLRPFGVLQEEEDHEVEDANDDDGGG